MSNESNWMFKCFPKNRNQLVNFTFHFDFSRVSFSRKAALIFLIGFALETQAVIFYYYFFVDAVA